MSWHHILGHEAHVQGFNRAFAANRLAHAYLFVGPPGVGKRMFALELARALLCESAVCAQLEACERCTSCTLAAAGTHPDIFTAGRPEESHELPIAVMRELGRAFALKTARGKGKVVILDDADDLNEEAANCFLKTLEEPPPKSVIVLIGTNPDRQLPTIISRCQVIRFAPLNVDTVRTMLQTRGVEDPALARRLALLSEGSPGRAMELADPALWAFHRNLVSRLVQPRRDTVALAESWMHFVEDAGKESAAQRRRAALVVKLLIEFLNGALCASVGKRPSLAEAEDLEAMKQLAGRAQPEDLLEALDRCLEAHVQIDRKVQLALIVEALMDALGQKLP